MQSYYLIKAKSQLLEEFKDKTENFTLPVVWIIPKGENILDDASPKKLELRVKILFLIKVAKTLRIASESKRNQYKKVFGESLEFQLLDFDTYWTIIHVPFAQYSSIKHIQNIELFGDVFVNLTLEDFDLLNKKNDDSDEFLNGLIWFKKYYENLDEEKKSVIRSILR